VHSSHARGPAIAATAIALALVNIGLAGVIALAVGARTLLPLWAALGLLVLGVLAAVITVLLWRAYLRQRRD
jgi:membrane protein implicated in regulation of membrane protease activity